MRSKSRRLAGWLGVLLTALVLTLVQAPSAALAEGNVARVGDVEYATFDEAFAAAADGQTITLLADVTTRGLDVSKDVTVDGGGHTLTFVEKGIGLRDGNDLTLKNLTATMAGVGSTPCLDFGWTWMSVSAQPNCSLTLDNAKLTMDGADAGNVHAIYLTGNNKLNLQKGSELTIKNYRQDALEWDGGDGGYNLNVTGGSKLVSDHNRSGLTGTFYATVDASTVDVVNSTGNGSNGSHFDIRNGSNVTFSGNVDHGLSAGNLSISNSTVTAENNGRNGIIFTGKGAFKAATVKVSGTKGKSYWNAGIRLMGANATLDVDAASKVSITGNQVTGLFLDGDASATFADDATLSITGNDASQANCATKKDLAQCGGGVVVRGGASLVLPAAAQVNNNRAALAGDDAYVEEGGSLGLSAANAGTELNAFDGCAHAIDAWYDDSADARWSADAAEKNHAVPVAAGEHAGVVALKAAHGLHVDYAYVGDAPAEAQLPAPATGLASGAAFAAAEQQAVDGWTFDGWYVDEACTTKWVDGTVLDASMTLYGKWTKDPEPAPAPEPQEPTKPSSTTTTTVTKTTKKVPATGDVTSQAFAVLAVAGIAAAAVAIKVRK
ncbi:InlB B-repeat-containing protein [Paratractidigestivibacter faecalis]|uniref:InlB B-repeat-containing protein n=1 Tax=Paratractidigestivibacter faecalis TaxID=2292441 RepID=UPI00388DBBF6